MTSGELVAEQEEVKCTKTRGSAERKLHHGKCGRNTVQTGIWRSPIAGAIREGCQEVVTLQQFWTPEQAPRAPVP